MGGAQSGIDCVLNQPLSWDQGGPKYRTGALECWLNIGSRSISRALVLSDVAGQKTSGQIEKETNEH
jgi:hypothetical protein